MSFINQQLEEMKENEDETSFEKLKIIGIGQKASNMSKYLFSK